MTCKTCKEIYNDAMVLGQTYNSDFLTFQSAVSFINDKYRMLYDIIVQSDSDFYIRELIIDENDYPLPCDLYNIKTVRFLSSFGDKFEPIERQPEKSYVPGTYTITNNVFHYNGDINRKIQIRYNPVPATLTMPFELEEMDIEPLEFGKMYDDGIYFKDLEGKEMFYDFGTKEAEPAVSYKPYITDYVVDYDAQTVFDEAGNDLSDNYTRFGTFTNIFFDDPYSIAEYDNGEIYIFTDHCGTLWNVKATTGHKTTGKIFGFHTDDSTGYGCIYFDDRDDKYYRAPFVPDTILSYTNNTLFYLLEVQLAIMLSTMVGNAAINANLPTEETRATEAFYNEIRQNKAGPQRINNLVGRMRFM